METNNKEIKRRSTFSLLLYTNRTKVREDGIRKLLRRVSIDVKPAPINISASVDPLLWNSEIKRANGRGENAQTANLAIEKLTEKATGHYRHTHKSLGFVTTELAKNAVEGIGQKPFTLLALLREHNEKFHKHVGVDHKKETYGSYEDFYNILTSFMKKKRGKEDAVLRSPNQEFHGNSETLLHTDREMKLRTVHGHLYRLKRMAKRVASRGILRYDPYRRLHLELPRRKGRYLKLEGPKRLMETPVDKPNLQQVRDQLLFATFTGLSYADLKHLSERDITQPDDGTYWIYIRRQKTKTPSAICLLNAPLQIIERYRHEHKSDRTFNFYCRGYLTRLTRGLGRIYGFDIAFRKARHNFGTHIMPSLGMPIETISRMVGRENTFTTQICAKVTDRKADEDMERLKGQTKNRKINLYEEDEPGMIDIITVDG